MSFYVYTARDGLNYRHDEHPPSVTVLDAAMSAISPPFETSDDYDSATSLAANRYAIGHWKGKDLSLFDLRSGEPRATFPFQRIGPMVTFDRSGERLLFKSGSKAILLNVCTGDWIELKGIRAIDRLIVDLDRNQTIIPSQRKDELLSISLDTGDVKSINLPFNATLFDLKRSPDGSRIIAIDRKKCLHSIDASDWSIEWSTSLRKQLGSDHMGVGQFCGDGTLFGAAVSGKGRNYTLVINTETGEAVNSIDAICSGVPHVGTLVRNQASLKGTYTFKSLDLSSGSEGTLTLSPKGG